MMVHSSVPARTVPEFIAYAKTNPGKINMASAGIGSAGHLAGELFKMMAGVNLVHVPYRGNAPALADLIAGQVQVLFPSAASSIEYVKTGKVRGHRRDERDPLRRAARSPDCRRFHPSWQFARSAAA